MTGSIDCSDKDIGWRELVQEEDGEKVSQSWRKEFTQRSCQQEFISKAMAEYLAYFNNLDEATTTTTLRKQDLCFWLNNKALLVDVTMISELYQRITLQPLGNPLGQLRPPKLYSLKELWSYGLSLSAIPLTGGTVCVLFSH